MKYRKQDQVVVYVGTQCTCKPPVLSQAAAGLLWKLAQTEGLLPEGPAFLVLGFWGDEGGAEERL